MPASLSKLSCYILAGGATGKDKDLQQVGELTRLERGYRRYAAIFDDVRLVIKDSQATEQYLNYPHICDEEPEYDARVGIVAALEDAHNDAVFIGSSRIDDFPLQLPVELLKQYQGESFLGFASEDDDGNFQPLFGIYSKSALEHLGEISQSNPFSLPQDARLLPLPKDVAGDCLHL